MDNFSLFPLGQARFLLKLIESDNNTAYAQGKAEGSATKELKRKGFIEPFGYYKRRIRWKLIKPLSKSDIYNLKKLMK